LPVISKVKNKKRPILFFLQTNKPEFIMIDKSIATWVSYYPYINFLRSIYHASICLLVDNIPV